MNNIIQRLVPAHMVFFAGNDKTEIMRLTRDGVFVNPDVAVDDAAKAVLDAIDSQIKVLVQRAVEDEREACAKVCDDNAKEWIDGNNDWCQGQAVGSNDCAAAIRARGEK